ncbi:hypothetical protein [Pedobacter sp. Leaf132]|uniref:hypothetical protein n=1 Tax=Pedobacter sp. Leaf132 TaxID=2876557 RepID=UPI001E2F1C38|nr:hypothetical protein [Pedobacter sp. Leaf132]
MKINSKFIQESVQKHLYERSHVYQACNYSRSGYHESDVLAVTKSLIVTEVEIKISRGDFKADFRKGHKHHRMQNPTEDRNSKVPNRFYYACPKGLINASEIPAYAGLMYVDEFGKLEVISSAPMLHKVKAEEKLIIGMLENLTAKTVFGCQYMTYKNRESAALYAKQEFERKEQTRLFIEHAKSLKTQKIT